MYARMRTSPLFLSPASCALRRARGLLPPPHHHNRRHRRRCTGRRGFCGTAGPHVVLMDNYFHAYDRGLFLMLRSDPAEWDSEPADGHGAEGGGMRGGHGSSGGEGEAADGGPQQLVLKGSAAGRLVDVLDVRKKRLTGRTWSLKPQDPRFGAELWSAARLRGVFRGVWRGWEQAAEDRAEAIVCGAAGAG